MQRRVVDQEMALGLDIATRAQRQLLPRQVGFQYGADRLPDIGAGLCPLLLRVVPQPNAGLQIAGALARSGKIVTGKIEGELAGVTSDRIAVDPTPSDAVGAAAQA